MANTSSARKAHRASLRKRVFNLRRKRAMHNALTSVSRALSGGSKDSAAKSLPALYQALDKAAKRNVITKNTAARMKSRITKRIAALAK